MMRNEDFLGGRVKLWNVADRPSLAEAVECIVSETTLPDDRHARLLLKPNLNNDLIGLTGNSTDLRVLRTVIGSLKKRGYRNLTVADGPNLGIARTGADVLKRLGIRGLCQSMGVPCYDVNSGDSREVTLDNKITVRIAKKFLDADCVINLPTVKTHAEVMFSCCMKNFIGIVVGACKRQVHRDLVGGIVALNQLTPIFLNIVDGLVAMEGDGPGDGVPRQLNWILSGRDPFLTDAVIARLIGLDPFEEVPYLREAFGKGFVEKDDAAQISSMTPRSTILRPKPRKWTSRILGHWSVGRVRDTMRPLFDNSIVRPFLHRHGVVQDIYEAEEADVKFEFVEGISCGDCLLCSYYCPMGLKRDDILDESKGCIQCGYCYWVCSTGKIRMVGHKGYLSRHMERYKTLIENAVSSGQLKEASPKLPFQHESGYADVH